MTSAGLYRFLHILGVALWVGVGVVTMFLAARARRTGDGRIVAFAYRTAAQLNKTVGLAGMVLTLVGGIALTAVMGLPFFQPFPMHWLFQMQVLGILAVAVGLFYQIPLGDRLARAAEASATAGEESAAFQKYRRRNALVSSFLGAVLLVVILLATLKP